MGSSDRMYNAKWITCWLLHSSRFFLLFSRASCQYCAHPSGGDLFGFPRPELRWCLSGCLVTGLGCKSRSSREFELCFSFFPCLFSLVRSCRDVQRRFGHDLHCPWPWLFFFSHLGRNLLLLYQPPLSALTFFGYFQLFGTHCRNDVNRPKNIKKNSKNRGRIGAANPTHDSANHFLMFSPKSSQSDAEMMIICE